MGQSRNPVYRRLKHRLIHASISARDAWLLGSREPDDAVDQPIVLMPYCDGSNSPAPFTPASAWRFLRYRNSSLICAVMSPPLPSPDARLGRRP